ncbi:MAG: sialate O-acetylesterase [Phycisphaerae bacterium]
MNRSTRLTCLFLACLFIFALPAAAAVKLPAVIGDNMVLQRDMKVPIWGTADPGEKVTVTIGDQKAATTAGADGRWMVRLDPLKAGGPFEMTVAGNNKITLKDILVGEVWVCSGQSNMAMTVKAAANAHEEISAAKYPDIRLFTVARKVAATPQSDTQGSWVRCSPETVGDFSAAAYYFGRHLYRELDVPIGLIHSSWGGTPAEAWTSRSTLEADPALKAIVDRWDEQIANARRAGNAAENKRPAARGAKPPADLAASPGRPSSLYNGMIQPLIPYAIRGAIWYQGEANAGRAYQYRKLFPAMIQDWRKAWGQGDFPFLFVQLANFQPTKPEPSDSTWAELREAQTMTLSLPKTGMAVIIDIGEAKDIHPKNKQDVGKRLALAALAIAYGKDVAYSGPMYDSMKIEGDRIRLTFKHVDGGLVAKDGKLKGFAIAGADRKFVWAEAQIDGDTVVVHSDKVARPVAVRYAWADNPECNLYNKAGLPASPFRTDDWPGVTATAKATRLDEPPPQRRPANQRAR